MSVSAFEVKKCKRTAGNQNCDADPACFRSAKFKCSILGWPVGTICDAHRREWISVWESVSRG